MYVNNIKATAAMPLVYRKKHKKISISHEICKMELRAINKISKHFSPLWVLVPMLPASWALAGYVIWCIWK